MLRMLAILTCCASLSGCYYWQAAAGQWEVVRKRQPLQEVMEDPETSSELSARLALLAEARDFSIAELGLPDNNSYRTYADLERDYVVWNVFAAPEFSLLPKVWCFPVAGCVSYRGYFSKDAAEKAATRLEKQGYDVAVGGVAAYSTLGNFDDPILNTMLHWDDTAIVALLFHELAHQVVYVQDDSTFNESFATAVEEFGIEQWLTAQGQAEKFEQYDERRAYRERLTSHILAARGELQALYTEDIDVDLMRAGKAELLAALVVTVEAEAAASGRQPSGWINSGMNNAHLISTSLYKAYLPAFRTLRAGCEDLQCFYAAANELAAMEKDEREARLAAP